MSVFVLLSPDPFVQSFNSVAGDLRVDQTKTDPRDPFPAALNSFYNVRRPVRGLQVKGDTYAVIQVLKSDGSQIPLIDSAGPPELDKSGVAHTKLYSNFIIQAISESRAEKSQVVLNFGVPIVFLFGEQPRVIQVQGVLMNTQDFNWKSEFLANYDLYMRGTKCVESDCRVTLSWGDVVVQGYMTDCAVQETAAERSYVTFNFTLLLTNYTNLEVVGDPFGHEHGSEVLPPVWYTDQVDPVTGSTLMDPFRDLEAEKFDQSMREANLNNFRTSNPTLLEVLRNDYMAIRSFSLTNYFAQDMVGNVASFRDKINEFIGRRTIRVPAGFTGGVSIDNSSDKNTIGAVSIYNYQGDVVRVNLPKPVLPAPTVGRLSLNEDEFVSRRTIPLSLAGLNGAFIRDQLADSQAGADYVKSLYQRLGVQIGPPSQMQKLMAQTAFVAFNLTMSAIRGRTTIGNREIDPNIKTIKSALVGSAVTALTGI